MSEFMYRSRIESCSNAIANLAKDKANIQRKISEQTKKASAANQAAVKEKNQYSRESKLKEAVRCQDEIASLQKRIGDIEHKISQEERRRSDAEKSLQSLKDRQWKDREQKDRQRQQQQDLAARRMIESSRRMADQISRQEERQNTMADEIERLGKLPEKITVLMLSSNPIDQMPLRLDEEARSIESMIRSSQHRDSVELKTVWAIRPLDVLQALNQHKPRIIHFSGHGSEEGDIVFQDDQGEAKSVSKEAISATLAASSGDIQLVFFNACFSAKQAQEVVQHISAAIGMNDAIGDEAARVFSAQFYSAIGFGLPLSTAFNQAKAALMLQGIPEENTPELFCSPGVLAEKLILVRPPEV